MVKACLGVTRCVGVTQWAIGDADSWIPGFFSGQGAATMFDQSYNPKPAFTAVQNTLGGSSGQNTVTVTNPGTQHRDRRHRCQPADPGDRLGVGADPDLLRDRPAGRAWRSTPPPG